MSFFTKIENAEHSAVAWIEKTLAAVEGKAPSIARVVDAGLEYIGPALQLGLTAIGQVPAAAAIGTVVAAAQTKLLALSALVKDLGPSPTIASAFTDVKTNLSSVLTTIDVKNTAAVTAVTKAVNEVGMLASAVQVAATQVAASAAAPAPAPAAPVPAAATTAAAK